MFRSISFLKEKCSVQEHLLSQGEVKCSHYFTMSLAILITMFCAHILSKVYVHIWRIKVNNSKRFYREGDGGVCV